MIIIVECKTWNRNFVNICGVAIPEQHRPPNRDPENLNAEADDDLCLLCIGDVTTPRIRQLFLQQ